MCVNVHKVEGAETRKNAFECLTNICTNHYEHLSAYIQTIFGLTVRAIQQDEEEVANMAVEVVLMFMFIYSYSHIFIFTFAFTFTYILF